MVIEADGTVAPAQVAAPALGPALGLFGDAQYVHSELELAPGKRVVFYTDGLTEARNRGQQEFSEEGMMKSLRSHAGKPLSGLLDALVADVVTFTEEAEFEDDVCILGVDCTGN